MKTLEVQAVQQKIFEVRGYKVILDKDLAQMYDVTTSNLNKAVKRNIKRFPEDFMFQLNSEEFNLIFQNGTSSLGGVQKTSLRIKEEIEKRMLITNHKHQYDE
jgi:hypothetical protein